MQEEIKCPVCQSPMYYNGAGLAKNPKAPTHKCSNSNCKFQWDKNAKKYVPSDFITSIWSDSVAPRQTGTANFNQGLVNDNIKQMADTKNETIQMAHKENMKGICIDAASRVVSAKGGTKEDVVAMADYFLNFILAK